MTIYEKVKAACVEKKRSISQVERELGYARGSLSKWDEHTPSVTKVKQVADYLEKPIEYFL